MSVPLRLREEKCSAPICTDSLSTYIALTEDWCPNPGLLCEGHGVRSWIQYLGLFTL